MAKRLTPEQEQQIIDLSLQGLSRRAVAAQVGCTPKVVQDRWAKYRDFDMKERAGDTEGVRQDLIYRHQQSALDARRGYLAAQQRGEDTAAQRWLAQELASLKEIAKLTGSDAPAKVEHSGETGFTVVRIVEEIVAGAQ